MTKIRTGLLLSLLTLCALPAPAQAQTSADCDREFASRTMPCYLNTITWVEVELRGEHLLASKARLESSIRQQLEKALPMISHEAVRPNDFRARYGTDFRSMKYLQRGEFRCKVWTVGEDYPIALHIDCAMIGWGDYPNPRNREMSFAYLNYASSQNLERVATTGITQAVDRIAAGLRKSREESRR